jgi:acetyl-CoA acetyltransferase
MTLADMDVIEITEAFAAQIIGVIGAAVRHGETTICAAALIALGTPDRRDGCEDPRDAPQ